MKNEGFAGKPIEQHPSSVSSVGNQDVLKYSLVHQHGELTKENRILKARIAELIEALEPFAARDRYREKYCPDKDIWQVSSDELRAARRALEPDIAFDDGYSEGFKIGANISKAQRTKREIE